MHKKVVKKVSYLEGFRWIGGVRGPFWEHILPQGFPQSKTRRECRKMPSFTVFIREFSQSLDFGVVPNKKNIEI